MPTQIKRYFLVLLSLVVGTAVGGGMLAVPVVTGLGGFWPTLLMMTIVGVYMALTGLLLVEATLWMPPQAHFITLSRELLGPFGRIVVALLFVFISYFVLATYIAGLGAIFQRVIAALTSWKVGGWVGSLICIATLGWVYWCGRQAVGRLSVVLVVGLVLSYFILVGSGSGHASLDLLNRQDWIEGLLSLPLLVTIFGFQTVVPSLVAYRTGHGRTVGWAIGIGMLISWIFFVVWQALVLSSVPLKGSFGLENALSHGGSSITVLGHLVGRSWVANTATLFAFFGIITSFLGTGLALFDFLADGLGLRERPLGLVKLVLLVVVPSLALGIIEPKFTLKTLNAVGGFVNVLLLGMIPVIMVISGRYVRRLRGSFVVAGGRPLLIALLVLGLIILGIEVMRQIEYQSLEKNIHCCTIEQLESTGAGQEVL